MIPYLKAFKHWMETGYYKKNNQEGWDLYLRLLRYWGCLDTAEQKYINDAKKKLLGN